MTSGRAREDGLSMTLDGDQPLGVVAWLNGQGVDASAHLAGRELASLQIVLGEAQGLCLESPAARERIDCAWPLVPLRIRTLPDEATALDPFRRFIMLVHAICRPCDAHQWKAFVAGICALSRAAVRRCDATARSIALRFHPRDRFAIHGLVSGDRSGRVAQLAVSCPGLLALLAQRSHQLTVLPRLLDGVVHGVKLPALIDLLALQTPGVSSRDWRIWLRRAPAGVAGLDLASGPPGRIIADDIPPGRGAAIRWYEVMGAAARQRSEWRRDPRAHQSYAQAVRWLSGRAATLALRDPAWRRTGDRVEALLCYVHLSGGRIGRDRSSSKLLRQVARLAAGLESLREGAPCATARFADLMRLRLSPGPDLSRRAEGLRMRPLRCVGALQHEGLQQQHCAGAFATRALAGLDALYALEVGCERLTMLLSREHGQWVLADLRAGRNGEPSHEARRAVHRWLRAHSIVLPNRRVARSTPPDRE